MGWVGQPRSNYAQEVVDNEKSIMKVLKDIHSLIVYMYYFASDSISGEQNMITHAQFAALLKWLCSKT